MQPARSRVKRGGTVPHGAIHSADTEGRGDWREGVTLLVKEPQARRHRPSKCAAPLQRSVSDVPEFAGPPAVRRERRGFQVERLEKSAGRKEERGEALCTYGEALQGLEGVVGRRRSPLRSGVEPLWEARGAALRMCRGAPAVFAESRPACGAALQRRGAVVTSEGASSGAGRAAPRADERARLDAKDAPLETGDASGTRRSGSAHTPGGATRNSRGSRPVSGGSANASRGFAKSFAGAANDSESSSHFEGVPRLGESVSRSASRASRRGGACPRGWPT